MSKYYDDVYEMPEYDALLYTNKKNKSRRWSVRIKLQGRNGYIVKSCKTTKLHLAQEFAKKLHKTITDASGAGLDPRRSYKFCDVFEEFLGFHQRNGTLSKYRYQSLAGDYGRYFEPFFRNYEVQEITSPLWERFKIWRREFWTEERLAAATPSVRAIAAVNPTSATLRVCANNFGQFIKWCARQGYISHAPVIAGFQSNKQELKKRGAAFERTEWARLISSFKDDAFEEGNPNLTAAHFHQRRVIYYISMFMCGTMMRPSEAFRIKWRDIRWKPNKHNPNNEDLVIDIPAQVTKTKKHRTSIGTCSLANHMRDWRQLTKWGERNDFVFPAWGGGRQSTMNKSFVKRLTELNMVYSHEGIKRTAYSCRHTGICFALDRKISEIDVSLLAGTSLVYIRNNYYSKNMERRSSDFATQFSYPDDYDPTR